jgi:hypothetical protein
MTSDANQGLAVAERESGVVARWNDDATLSVQKADLAARRFEPRMPAKYLIRSIVDAQCLTDAPISLVDVDPADIRLKG